MIEGYEELRSRVLKIAGWDLDAYKPDQLGRRLRALMARTRVSGLHEYASLLERDPARLKEFSDLVTVNVTEFFRNPERFEFLKSRILGLLPKEPRIWSAGCSNGSEPYSIAMILDDAGISHPPMLATDIDQTVLLQASRGYYSEQQFSFVPQQYRARYFEPSEEGFQVRRFLRDRVKFQQHNLLCAQYPKGFDLIVCRNVLIYFTEESKVTIVRRLRESLRPGGYLFVGSTETILGANSLGYKSAAPFFYQRS